MELSYEYRIYPNAAQHKIIARTFGCCRFVYNRALALRKATARLASENQVVCLEDLNVKGMLRNRRLSKSVADAAFSEVARQLEYKCAMRGGNAVRVGRFYPSSKTCSACGHVLEELPLSARHWRCPVRGAVHDRDANAAKNVLAEGLRILGENGTAGLAGTAA